MLNIILKTDVYYIPNRRLTVFIFFLTKHYIFWFGSWCFPLLFYDHITSPSLSTTLSVAARLFCLQTFVCIGITNRYSMIRSCLQLNQHRESSKRYPLSSSSFKLVNGPNGDVNAVADAVHCVCGNSKNDDRQNKKCDRQAKPYSFVSFFIFHCAYRLKRFCIRFRWNCCRQQRKSW